MLRTGLISLFQSRGGGLYALGYVVTFVVLEVLEIPEMFADLGGLFAGEGTWPGAVIALVADFFVDTLRNMIYAFVWPGLFLGLLGPIGVVLLAVGFGTYNTLLRPIVERFVPELKVEPSIPEESPEEPLS